MPKSISLCCKPILVSRWDTALEALSMLVHTYDYLLMCRLTVYYPSRVNGLKRTDKSSAASSRMESGRRLLDAVKFTPEQTHTVLQVLEAVIYVA